MNAYFRSIFPMILWPLLFSEQLYAQAGDGFLTVLIEIPIANGEEDVEERLDGSMYINSSDLELINEDNHAKQKVGLRFTSLQLPQGIEIIQAYIQFTTDEVSNDPCQLQIRAQAADDALAFSDMNNNLSSRLWGNEEVVWQVENWNTVGESGIKQQSADIAPLIQELVNRPNWQSGNALVFIFSGEGRRTAAAYESDPAQAATLFVEARFPLATEKIKGLYLNELMAANTLVADEFGETDDWVELYNSSDQPINIGGLYMSDEPDKPQKWRIRAPVIIPPKGFALLWLDGDEEQGGTHASFKLNSDGEHLSLVQKLEDQLLTLDQITFPKIPRNISYGRATDGAETWVFFDAISPADKNVVDGKYLDAEVRFSLAGGSYDENIQVELFTDDAEAQIYYTLDGSMPEANDSVYTEAIEINSPLLLSARALKSGYSGSKYHAETYIVNANHRLAVLSIQTEPENLWDDSIGIYIVGKNGRTGFCVSEKRNWNQDWERACLLSFFEENGEEAFRLDAGIKIGGGCSRASKMKSFNFYLRKDYGETKLEYPLFPQLEIEKFRRFKVRNSGNDFGRMMFRDGANQSVLFGTVDIDLMAYRPTVVYLNGTYWGLYGMRELFNQYYVEAHHGVDPDEIDLINNPLMDWYEMKEGDYDGFQQLKSFIQANDLSKPANYEYVASQIDINEYLNYHIAQVYLANYDWPANNTRVWRNRNGGKWRWMLFDTDASTNFGAWSESSAATNSIKHATSATETEAWPNGPESTLFLRKLLKNKTFNEEFIQRICTYADLIFGAERVRHITDSLQRALEPEVGQHQQRWTNRFGQWGWGDPGGGSKSSWYEFVDAYKDFFRRRRGYMMRHLQGYFGLDNLYRLSFNYDEKTKGFIYLHSNEVKIPANYEADYFQQLPLKIKAVPKPGYVFLKWEETAETAPEIEYIGEGDASLTPIFVPLQPVITEIHYQPPARERLEFIEIYNPTRQELDLSGYRFTKGIEFAFTLGTTLAGGEYALIVKDKSVYANISCQLFEWTSGELDDQGETISLVSSTGEMADELTYRISEPWPKLPNGASLSLKLPYLDNSFPTNWEAYFVRGGNPCGEQSPAVELDENEYFRLSAFPNPFEDILTIRYATLSNKPLQMNIYNLLGQKIESHRLEGEAFMQNLEFDLSHLTANIYLFLFGNEERYFVKKLMVKR